MAYSKFEKEYTVTEKMLAQNVGSGSLPVLATPAVAAMFENAAAKLAEPYLTQGRTTVGTKINIDHTAPTPLGAKLTVKAELTSQEGRLFHFHLTAEDESGLVASCDHERVSVNIEHFVEKARSRKRIFHES